MKFIIGLCLAFVALSQNIPPIPSFPDGFAQGPPVTTNYTLDVFFDHLCPYSAAAFPGLYLYWYNNQSWLRMVIHILPLPYHYYAFDVGRAGRYIQSNYNATLFSEYLNWMFQHQTKYLDAAQYWNQTQLYYYISGDTETATGVNATLVEAALNDSTYDYSLRLSWKYAMTKGITGTPTYMVNGVLVPEATTFNSTLMWEDFFDSLT